VQWARRQTGRAPGAARDEARIEVQPDADLEPSTKRRRRRIEPVFDHELCGYNCGMTEIPTVSNPTAGAEKDPDQWVTGEEPMTGAQASYLSTLARDTGRHIPETMTKAEASKLIDELQTESQRAHSAT
jgi:hypothetical protein